MAKPNRWELVPGLDAELQRLISEGGHTYNDITEHLQRKFREPMRRAGFDPLTVGVVTGRIHRDTQTSVERNKRRREARANARTNA